MRVTWLGQAGLLFKSSALTVLIDPYFSDSVGRIDPAKKRRIPVDPETAEHFLRSSRPMTVLAPNSVWQKARQYGGPHNFVLFEPGTQWTQGDIRFTAVPAAHSDPDAIGVLLQAENKLHYVTGDTLYNTNVLSSLPAGIDTVFLPVNGVGNNMNMADAARFAADCGAKCAVPIHIGLFDDLKAQAFPFEPKRILTVYKEEAL